MEQLRIVDTPRGCITYVLIRKRVKNLNLRVDPSGRAVVSIPLRCPAEQADRFVQKKAAWILWACALQTAPKPQFPPPPQQEVCAAQLRQALDRVYPLVQPLGVAYPHLKLRRMKSQWGNCHCQQGYITLNTALAQCPEPLQDYVALHELVHFLHPNHGPGFYALMDRLMPQWKTRRQELKSYAQVLSSSPPPV